MGHATYLVFELAWGLPVLVLQWVVGGAALWRRLGVVIVGVLVPSVYLSLVDAFAIGQGIWTLHATHITGVHIGSLPVEEFVFFVLTNSMVVQSIVLVQDRETLRKVRILAMIGRPKRGADAA